MEISRQSEYYGLSYRQAAPIPTDAQMKDMLSGPKIMAGLNRVADGPNGPQPAFWDKAKKAVDFMEQAAADSLSGPFKAVSGYDDYVHPNQEKSAGIWDKVNDFGKKLDPTIDKAEDSWQQATDPGSPEPKPKYEGEPEVSQAWRDNFGPETMARAYLPGFAVMDDVAHHKSPETFGDAFRGMFDVLTASADDGPIPFDELDRSEEDNWTCDRWGHEPNSKGTKCKDCGINMDPSVKMADNGDSGAADPAAPTMPDASAGSQNPLPDASSPVPPQFNGGSTDNGLFHIQFWPGMFGGSGAGGADDPHPPTGHSIQTGQPMLGG